MQCKAHEALAVRSRTQRVPSTIHFTIFTSAISSYRNSNQCKLYRTKKAHLSVGYWNDYVCIRTARLVASSGCFVYSMYHFEN